MRACGARVCGNADAVVLRVCVEGFCDILGVFDDADAATEVESE